LEDGSYGITGGTAGLGLLFAAFFAEKGATHLGLISRSGKVAQERLVELVGCSCGGKIARSNLKVFLETIDRNTFEGTCFLRFTIFPELSENCQVIKNIS